MTGDTSDTGCVFCAARAEGAAHPLVIWAGAEALVILNKFPYNNGHVMVVPHGHVASMGALGPSVLQEVALLTQRAEAVLMANLEGEALADPRRLRFTTGRRDLSWSHNVVALGLSGGFLEPLESTSIHLIQNGIARLFALFPDKNFNPLERDEYNRGMRDLYEDIRDFIILHYKATQRDDTPFWRYVRDMDIPKPLARKMELFKTRGRVFRENAELFSMPSWVAVMLGQNIWPEHWDTLTDALDEKRVSEAMAQMRRGYTATADALPTHEEFLRKAGAWAASDVRIVQP